MRTFDAQLISATIPAGGVSLQGELRIPAIANGLVLFAHGSGSSRNSRRNQRVADVLHDAGLATLLFDLLAPEEEEIEAYNLRLRFDVELLSRRLRAATLWARQHADTAGLMIGYFGASTGAAAALIAAAADSSIAAVVSRGGRADLAGNALDRLHAPTLLIAGGDDERVAALNVEAWARLRCVKSLQIIPGAGHWFEEPGALDNVAALAARWFTNHLQPDGSR